MRRAAKWLRPPAQEAAVPSISRLLSGPAARIQRSGPACGGKAEEGACLDCDNSGPLGAVQAKLTVGAPDDPLEKEADAVADKVMRRPESAAKPRRAQGFAAFGSASGGARLPVDALNFFEPRFARDLGHVRIHDDSAAGALARDIGAHAFTRGSHLYFAAGQYDPASAAGRRLLAHELVHTLQQGDVPAKKIAGEADSSAAGATGPDVHPSAHAPLLQRQPIGNWPPDKRPPTPREEMLVRRARERLKLLRRFVDEWDTREARRTRHARDREPMLEKRRAMDDDPASGFRGKLELNRVPAINQGPLRFEVTDEEVVIHIRFEVGFEDRKMSGRFSELKTNLERAVAESWNQRLVMGSFRGRDFKVKSDVALASESGARDRSRWLVTVRPGDKGQATHPGCTFDPLPDGAPTSVTDPFCDGGVMSIPPRHISMPDVLAHEILHLFGLIDRYVMLSDRKDESAPVTGIQTITMRETAGRKDVLGGDEGKVLQEDIYFIFDRLDIYGIDENKGLEILRVMEKSGMSMVDVKNEISHQEEIVRTGGRDPNSLIRERQNFIPEIIKSAEGIE